MSYQQFQVSQVNPNDTHGGSGCVCDPRKQEDCKPPYIIVQDNEMLDHLSPRVVICQSCVNVFHDALLGEALEIGERDGTGTHPLWKQAEQEVAEKYGLHPPHENPTVDDSELLAALKRPSNTPDI